MEERERTSNVFAGDAGIKNFLNPENNSYIPLVELPSHLNPFRRDGVRIFVKLMSMLPLMNVKSLPAFNMLASAEKRGDLKGVHSIVENSSGNTAFSLSTMGRLFGIRRTRAMVSNEVSLGKLQLLQFFGTEVVVNKEPICPDPSDKTSGIYKASKLGRRNGWFNPGQYDNLANPQAHEKWTGREIWEQTKGSITVFCAGMGTTGTLVGAGRYLKKKNPHLIAVGVTRKPNNPVPGTRTTNLLGEIAFDWKSMADVVIEMGTKDSFEKSMELSRSGLVVGPSSGFALAGLLRFLEEKKKMHALNELRNNNKEVVAVFVAPDNPLPYINEYFEYLDESYFPEVKNKELLSHRLRGEKRVSFKEKLGTSFEVASDRAYEMIYPVSPQNAWDALARGDDVPMMKDVLVIDVRSKGEFLHYRLPGAKRIDSEFIIRNLKRLISKWKKKKVILTCSMGIRTRALSEILRKNNIEAYSLLGGITAWSDKNLPRWRPEVCVV